MPLVADGNDRDVTIVLVRHGQSAGAVGPGDAGPPLTRLGHQQAARVARRLANQSFTRIYSSDLSRARSTADAIMMHHPRTPYVIDERIREVTGHHLGPEAVPADPDIRRVVQAERDCVAQFCDHLVDTYRAGDQVLLVVHGNLIRLVAALLAKVDPKQQLFFRTYNTSVTIMTFYQGNTAGQKVILAGCVKHLLPRQITNWSAN